MLNWLGRGGCLRIYPRNHIPGVVIDMTHRRDPGEEYMNSLEAWREEQSEIEAYIEGLDAWDKAAKDRRAKPHDQLFDGEFYGNLLSDDDHGRDDLNGGLGYALIAVAVVALTLGLVWIF